MNFTDLKKDSTIYKVHFENIGKSSKLELSGPKGYLFHKPIITRNKDGILDYLKLPLLDEKVLFGENLLINSFLKFNSCESYQNETIKQFTSLKFLNISELGAPNNSSNLWHNIDVELENVDKNCKNISNEFFFDFEFARSKIDNFQHQNLLKKASLKTGSPGKFKLSKNDNETGVNIRIGVMFYDLTDLSYRNGESGIGSLCILNLVIAFVLVLLK